MIKLRQKNIPLAHYQERAREKNNNKYKGKASKIKLFVVIH
jgi:hypothetical protein